MTTPRRQIVDPAVAGFYHCVSRCVRRAFLCGEDAYTGQSFEHRKAWVESRLLELAQWFAIGIYAYAVMSNHVHVVLRIDPSISNAWSPEEVARRWVGVFPARVDGEVDVLATQLRAQALAENPARVAVCRERLASVSWLMRCLCEPIARRANREDGCTGRFWEGRFKSQALLDETAVLACMTYVDLNPVRAGVVKTVDESTHVSIQRRLSSRHAKSVDALRPVAGLGHADALPVREADYLALVSWTADRVRLDATSDSPMPPRDLARITGEPAQWSRRVLGIERDHYRAIGAVEALLAKAQAMGQRWLKGLGSARALAGVHDRSR